MKTKAFQIFLMFLSLAVFAVTAMVSSPALAAKGGNNATTLAGYKTIDICVVDPTDENPAGTIWRYSGEIAVWNEGVLDTVGLNITDFIEYKPGNKWIKAYDMPVTPYDPILHFGEIPAGTTLTTATIFTYSYDGAPLSGSIRNNASITILNHSNFIGKPFGPNPKATYTGLIPPPPCQVDLGCTYTQGYWGTYGPAENPHTWPTGFSRDDIFFLATSITASTSKGVTTCTQDTDANGNLIPLTWQQVMDTEVSVSQGYYQLAHQYIAAVLNQANGAFVPQGVQDTLDYAEAWLQANNPCACTSNGSCGIQKDWAAVLDDYNNGIYQGGPPHCE
ncbi:MAG: hypothetical protein OEW04_13170 [Nitrospirota bacterium]|nr:hypothetical protein [Nitrospirota bacterium]